MGAYLSTPVTEKDTVEGEGKAVEYGVSSMQGWRRTMEDAHLAITELRGNTEVGIFGVFDGHGGGEVAKFCQKHLATEFSRMEGFRQGHIGEGLIQVFHRIDDMLRDEAHHQELQGYRSGSGRPPGAGGAGDGGTASAASPAAAASAASGSNVAGSASDEPPTAEQQQTLDVMKRIMEIKRMVTEGAGGGASGTPPGGRQANGPAGGGKTGAGSLLQLAQGGEGAAGDDSKFRAAPPDEGAGDNFGQVGCTAVVAVLKGRELYVANAGDSRAVLGRGKTAVPLSEDHKPASAPEKQRITNAGGFVSEVGGVTRVNGNLNLSRAIGDLRYKTNTELPPERQIITAQPDVRRVALTPADRFFLLACDGIWDVLTNQQAVDFVNERLDAGMGAAAICAELLDSCLARNPKEARGIGCDNMTASVIVFKQ